MCSEAFLLFYFLVQNGIWRFLALGCSFNSNIVPEFCFCFVVVVLILIIGEEKDCFRLYASLLYIQLLLHAYE